MPQGSVLGPILFLLYVNDIPEMVKSCVWIFATTDHSDQLQNDLKTLMEWAELWELTFNVLKYKIIHYSLNKPEHDYTMNNEQLESVEEECDLGVTFSRDLKFSEHITKKITRQIAY